MGPEQASVVVVTHNEGPLLRQTVDSLIAGTPGLGEIVVVDDASDDGSTDFLATPPDRVRVARLDRSVGISAARNHGGRLAGGDVVVFSDAHCTVEAGWLDPLLRLLEDPEVGEVTPAVGHIDGRPGLGYGFTWKEPSMRMAWLKEPPEDGDVPFICGCFLAMRKPVFEECGGFDEGMYRWGYEDAELSLRLWLRGYRCKVAPDATIRHLFRKRFPYEVDWSGVIYNGLRMATVHFEQDALTTVVGHFTQRREFSRAWGRLADSDTTERRVGESRVRRRGAGEFFAKMSVGGVT